MDSSGKYFIIFLILLFNIKNSLLANGDSNSIKQEKDKWIAIDKIQHFGYSLFVSLGSQYILVNKLDCENNKAIPISSFISFSAGLAKEIQDKKSSFFSKKDMIANIMGISAAIIIMREP